MSSRRRAVPSLQAVGQDVADRHLGAAGDAERFLVVAGLDHGHQLLPERRLLTAGGRQVDPALDGDGGPDDQHDDDGVHEHPALLKESDDCTVGFHGSLLL
jgi:hypothetical protein